VTIFPIVLSCDLRAVGENTGSGNVDQQNTDRRRSLSRNGLCEQQFGRQAGTTLERVEEERQKAL